MWTGQEDGEDEEGGDTLETQGKEPAHRRSKLPAGAKQVNSTGFIAN
jgi:hypothetical protein